MLYCRLCDQFIATMPSRFLWSSQLLAHQHNLSMPEQEAQGFDVLLHAEQLHVGRVAVYVGFPRYASTP